MSIVFVHCYEPPCQCLLRLSIWQTQQTSGRYDPYNDSVTSTNLKLPIITKNTTANVSLLLLFLEIYQSYPGSLSFVTGRIQVLVFALLACICIGCIMSQNPIDTQCLCLANDSNSL